jgi:hypothetical protein
VIPFLHVRYHVLKAVSMKMAVRFRYICNNLIC